MDTVPSNLPQGPCPRRGHIWGASLRVQPKNADACCNAVKRQINNATQATMMRHSKFDWSTKHEVPRRETWPRSSRGFLRRQTNQQLFRKRKICASLLVTSRAYHFNQSMPITRFIKSAITSIVRSLPAYPATEVRQHVCGSLHFHLWYHRHQG